jgi:hypothetical protein
MFSGSPFISTPSTQNEVRPSREVELYRISQFNNRTDQYLLEKAENCTDKEFAKCSAFAAAVQHKVSKHNQMLLMLLQCTEDSTIIILAEKLLSEIPLKFSKLI